MMLMIQPMITRTIKKIQTKDNEDDDNDNHNHNKDDDDFHYELLTLPKSMLFFRNCFSFQFVSNLY